MSKPDSLNEYLLKTNPTFWRAIGLLSHPLVLISLVILLVNDHILRVYWPSWLTGKLGDLVWLFLAPIALAAVVSWFIPLKNGRNGQWIFGLSSALVFLVFVLMKLCVDFNEMATRILSALLFTRLKVIPDPTDLFALPALLTSALVWYCIPAPQTKSKPGLVALPLAALLTLANSGMPDPGIYCFQVQENQITAQAGYSSYVSLDGGVTWQPESMGAAKSCERKFAGEDGWLIVSGLQENTAYRFQSGRTIEISTDAGKNWRVIRDFQPIHEAKRQYYINTRQGYVEFLPGPLDAIADPNTGNILFAMGQQGVLILDPDGRWNWSSVDTYQTFEDFPNLDAFGILLGSTIYLAGAFGLLVLTTLSLRWASSPLRMIAVSLAWVAWLVVDIVFPPAIATNYGTAISGLGIIGIYIFLVPLTVDLVVRFARRKLNAWLPVLGISIIAILVYFIPYILWLFSTLPSLLWATIFGLVIGGMVLLWGFLYVRAQADPYSSTKDLKSETQKVD